jgi:hypothetical protein
MKMNLSVVNGFLAAVALVLAVGCGESRQATAPVSGTVTYKGAPVEGATVAFVSTTGAESATGMTDAAGRYTLSTFEKGDGAMLGEFKVRVFKYEGSTEEVQLGDGTGPEEMPDDYVPPQEGGAAPSAGPKHMLPEVYASFQRTPLSFTVEKR